MLFLWTMLMPSAVIISDMKMQKVILNPIKASNVGMCISKHLDPEYIAYQARARDSAMCCSCM